MIGFIYFLKNPLTQEVFYIGATLKSLSDRLETHYQHLKEALQEKRGWNKRYAYLHNMGKTKAEICLIEIVEDVELLDQIEIMYIGLFRSWGFNLTNSTDGGKGGNVYKHMTSVRKALTTLKLKKVLTGRKKPEGFAERLSSTRRGLNNPMVGKSKIYPIACFENESLIKVFQHAFEVNEFIGSKHASGNVKKALDNSCNAYGYSWKQYKI